MKKLILLALTLAFSQLATAQIINIPDPNFKAALLSANVAQGLDYKPIKIDTNNNGEIEKSEALSIPRLNVDSKKIKDLTGIEAFENLTFLGCAGNELTNLDVSQNINLNYLRVSGNQLTNLDVSQNINLNYLDVGGNQLTNLDLSQNINLNDLNCNANQFTNLDVSKNLNLIRLNCIYNQITNLDLGKNINLNYVRVSRNLLTNLDVSQNINLSDLGVLNNLLTNLDLSQNINLNNLEVDSNKLTNLDVSQNINLNKLGVSNNLLTNLDVSQNTNLRVVDVSNNLLTSIDLNNKKIKYLNLSGNVHLTLLFLKVLKGSLVGPNCEQWGCSMNLTNLPNLKYVCVNEGYEDQMKNILNDYGYNCEVNTYCSFVPGGEFYTVNGIAKNCSNSSSFSQTKFALNSNDNTISGYFIADKTGNYSTSIQAGTYTITPKLENPNYFTVTPESITVSFPEQNSPYLQDFCFEPNGTHPDLEVTLVPKSVSRPGFDSKYEIVYKNKGNQVQSGSITLNYDNAFLTYIQSTPTTTPLNGKLIWDFMDLLPNEIRKISFSLKVNSPVETPAVNNGDIIKYTANINGSQTDETPDDNTFTLNETVVGSYDPNDKMCLEGDVITPDLVGNYLHYRIRFENTGTYFAENVVVRDDIDSSVFDVSSIVPLSSSHDYTMRINGNKVEFIFEGIKLPFEDGKNDGYVMFKIKTNPNLALNTSLNNKASIYFDYNAPIITNTATTTVKENIGLGLNDFEFGDYFTLSPNPASEFINLKSSSNQVINKVELFNIQGQILNAVSGESIQKIEISELPKGIYILQAHTSKGKTNTKFVKN